MTNDVTTPNGVIRTDETGGIHTQVVKIAVGAEDTVTYVTSAVPLPTMTQRTSTATLSNVAASATNVTILASNANRQGAFVYNDSTAVLYLKFGAIASTTSHTVQLAAGQLYEIPVPVYTGIIDGLWASATGTARVTELS